MSHLRIGVAGIGFVGGAMLASFRKQPGAAQVTTYDKYRGIGEAKHLLHTDILFLALPTELDGETKAYDLSAIHDVCSFLQLHAFSGVVVLKSTVLPGTTEQLAQRYAHLQLVHNPEFLSAATAERDFHEQRHIVLGKHSSTPEAAFERLRTFYATLYPAADITVCSCGESEMMKIGCNAFYSVKIQFFNEIHALCARQGLSYDCVKEMMLKNGWIHPMHTRVPGHDGQLSFGGKCLPKDSCALAEVMRAQGTPHRVVRAAVEEQAAMRLPTPNGTAEANR